MSGVVTHHANQLGRRNINAFVRSELALIAKPIIEAKARANQQGGRGGVLLSQKSDEALRTDNTLATMTARRVIDAIETLADEKPEELVVLLISACNQLRAAVDEGRADVMLLVQLRDHIQRLIYNGPKGLQQ